MDRRLFVSAIVVLVVGGMLIGAATVVSADEHEEDDPNYIQQCAAEPPDDFEDPPEGNDAIGWFEGYWYNEPLDFEIDDGLTEEQLEELSARTAARYEALRCLTFEELPDVDIITRDEFAEETAQDFEDIDENTTLFDNAQHATLLTIGHDEDSIDVREATRQVAVGGYYNFVDEEIVVVSDDPDALRIDEEILAHELGHALQDQIWDLEQYDRPTNDIDAGKLGVIEGDVTLIENRYLEMCEAGSWGEPCLTEEFEDDDEAPEEPPNWAVYFQSFQPYSDGPNFIQHILDDGGWEAVDALYEDMPDTSTHIIHPETYNDFEMAELTVPDESTDDWDRLTFEEGPDYQVMGEGGIVSIFFAPTYETVGPGQVDIIDPLAFLNVIDQETGELDPYNPIDYNQPPTNNWIGDKMYVYADDDGDTASVWKLAFDSADGVDQFVDAYEQLIDYRGGDPHETYADTYTFGDGSAFDMALTLDHDGDRLWVVTAPTVDAFDEVHGVELTEIDTPPEDTPTPTPPDEPVSTPTPPPDATPTPAPDDTPGYGLAIAVAAILIAAIIAHLRRRQ